MGSQEFSDQRPDFGIMVPCAPEDFGKFLSSLLGRARTLEGRYLADFVVNSQQIEDLYHVIDQRMQQNPAAQVYCGITIRFSDYSQVVLNSLLDFKHYREVRPVRSVAVVLTMSYLVKFPQAELPEKQTIEVELQSEVELRRLDAQSLVDGGMFHVGGRYRIEHTNRSFGSDMQNLIMDRFKTIERKPARWRETLRRYSSNVAWVTALVYLVISIAATFFAVEHLGKYVTADLDAVKAANSIAELGNNDIVAAQHLKKGVWAKALFMEHLYLLASCIVAVLIANKMHSLSFYNPKSYLLLTDASVAEYEEQKVANRWNAIKLVGTGLTSVLLGLAQRVAFHFISKWLL